VTVNDTEAIDKDSDNKIFVIISNVMVSLFSIATLDNQSP